MFLHSSQSNSQKSKTITIYTVLALFLKTKVFPSLLKLFRSFQKKLHSCLPSLCNSHSQLSLPMLQRCKCYSSIPNFPKRNLIEHRTAAREHGWAEMMKKDITCPTAGGTATLSHACHTGPPPTSVMKHPHSKPTGSMEHTKSKKWDGTVTMYPSGAPEVTMTPGIDCEGETGPSCSFITFAKATCSEEPLSASGSEMPKHHKGHKTHSSFPTITASAGATKTVHAKHTATCKAAAVTNS